ncbi:MAG: class SAM-dependent methyltransferase [Herminiimonas sp.]|nr:class SAM-dependent methyltransferase [Herminiimonas sp.]
MGVNTLKTIADGMELANPAISRDSNEAAILDELLSLKDAHVLELGCGKADKTRALAEGGAVASITALEVDEIQHAKNLKAPGLKNVQFKLGGAEAIPAPDNSFDIVLMFKSLHHVPLGKLDAALAEIRRVLKAGGVAYLSEPIFAGPYNDILRLFHDEEAIRKAAFAAIRRAVESGTLELVGQTFFNAPVRFSGFAQFEEQVLNVTHTQHRLSAATHEAVRAAFERHATPDGVKFSAPMRVDLLRKPR